jgi:hypothetical protein
MADKGEEGGPFVCPSVAQTSLSMAAEERVTISWLSPVRSNGCSPPLFRGLSAAARVEYVLVALVDVVAMADKRGEGGPPLVCPSVAQMSLTVTPQYDYDYCNLSRSRLTLYRRDTHSRPMLIQDPPL